MSLRNLPEARTFERPKNFQWDAPGDVFSRWAEGPRAAESTDNNVISIFDVIGEDWWSGGGFTAKRMSAALRSIGADKDVVVEINSPGGDLFEGIAIYNILRSHKAKVTVHVLGWAASAASIIAMAGDDIRMGRGTFMMVHNAWGVVMGNRHDFTEASTLFETFDAAIADIYQARTGRKLGDIQKLMDAETFMDPQKAVSEKFADGVDDELGAKNDARSAPANSDVDRRLMARRQAEGALARAGYTRGHRAQLLSDLSAARDAGGNGAGRDAGKFSAGLRQLLNTMKA